VPAKAKLTDEQVKKIRRRVRAGEQITDLALEYDVNRKTIRRGLDALELADAERARRRATRPAAEKRMKRLLGPDYRNPDRAPEHRRDPPPPSDEQPEMTGGLAPQPSTARLGYGGVPLFPKHPRRSGRAPRLLRGAQAQPPAELAARLPRRDPRPRDARRAPGS